MAEHESKPMSSSPIPLDYFTKVKSVQRWKWRLSGIALLAIAGWFAVALLRGDHGQLQFSRGPLASVHATWDASCNACHTPFTPINGETALANFGADPHSSDQNCKTCHAGPEHHARQKPGEVASCAACHREHEGRDAALVRVPDSHCTNCHRNLDKHVEGATLAGFTDTVTGFSKDKHPEFRRLAVVNPIDPGQLKFNHSLHMTPGMVLVPDGKPWTLADIQNPEDRHRYRGAGNSPGSTPVQLDCATCHRTEGTEFNLTGKPVEGLPGGILPPRGSGAYMLPITYEVHCLACHPLTFDSKKETVAVPHRLQPDHIHDFLRGFYANEALSENPAFFERRVPSKRPLPGKVALDEDVTLRKAIADKVVLAEKTLYLGKRTCGECHHYEEPGLISPKRIVPTKVPTIWFEHAKFDHLPHRSVTCRECHPKAYGTDGSGKMTHTGSTLSSDILIPGIDNCLRCHAPSTKSAGGARFDCVECHRYHNGDNPLQGLGAKARSPK